MAQRNSLKQQTSTKAGNVDAEWRSIDETAEDRWYTVVNTGNSPRPCSEPARQATLPNLRFEDARAESEFHISSSATMAFYTCRYAGMVSLGSVILFLVEILQEGESLRLVPLIVTAALGSIICVVVGVKRFAESPGYTACFVVLLCTAMAVFGAILGRQDIFATLVVGDEVGSERREDAYDSHGLLFWWMLSVAPLRLRHRETSAMCSLCIILWFVLHWAAFGVSWSMALPLTGLCIAAGATTLAAYNLECYMRDVFLFGRDSGADNPVDDRASQDGTFSMSEGHLDDARSKDRRSRRKSSKESSNSGIPEDRKFDTATSKKDEDIHEQETALTKVNSKGSGRSADEKPKRNSSFLQTLQNLMRPSIELAGGHKILQSHHFRTSGSQAEFKAAMAAMPSMPTRLERIIYELQQVQRNSDGLTKTRISKIVQDLKDPDTLNQLDKACMMGLHPNNAAKLASASKEEIDIQSYVSAAANMYSGAQSAASPNTGSLDHVGKVAADSSTHAPSGQVFTESRSIERLPTIASSCPVNSDDDVPPEAGENAKKKVVPSDGSLDCKKNQLEMKPQSSNQQKQRDGSSATESEFPKSLNSQQESESPQQPVSSSIQEQKESLKSPRIKSTSTFTSSPGSLNNHESSGSSPVEKTTSLAVLNGSIDPLDLDALSHAAQKKVLGRWDGDIFALDSMTTNSALVSVGLGIFEKLGIGATLNDISRQSWAAFCESIQSGYCANPYHSHLHGADACTSMYFLLTKVQLLKEFSSREQTAAVIAAMAHDVKHPGVTNAFLVAIGDPLALTYNDKAVLESFHAAECFRQLKLHGILANMVKTEYAGIRRLIISIILETDMSCHFEHVGSFRAHFRDRNVDWSNDDRSILLKMMMKVVDVAHSTKPARLHQRWSKACYEEFFAQGRREKELGLPVGPLNDENTVKVSSAQVGFIRALCLPMYEAFNDVLDREPIFEEEVYSRLRLNLNMWTLDKNLEESEVMKKAEDEQNGHGSDTRSSLMADLMLTVGPERASPSALEPRFGRCATDLQDDSRVWSRGGASKKDVQSSPWRWLQKKGNSPDRKSMGSLSNCSLAIVPERRRSVVTFSTQYQQGTELRCQSSEQLVDSGPRLINRHSME